MMSKTISFTYALRLTVQLFIVMAVAGCAGHNEAGVARTAAAAAVPVPAIEAAEKIPPYRLQVGDVLAIRFLLNEEFDEEVTIRPDGKISTAVAQDIPAYGRTPLALQNELNEHYRIHLSDPHAAVIVKAFAPTKVYVLGEVSTPGQHSFDRTPTLLQAIAHAGGVKNSARHEEILIMRRGYEDESKIYTANYSQATSGVNPDADIQLAAHDVIYVPRTNVAKAYVQFEQYVQQFLRPAIGVGL